MSDKRDKCPICGTDVTLSESFSKTMVKCRDCGLIYGINACPREEETQSWENLHINEGDRERKSLFVAILKTLKKFRPQRGRILDVGCGIGEFISIARNNGWDAEGTEISLMLCKITAENTECRIHYGYIEEIDLGSKSYDVITFIDVLRHTKNPLQSLKCAKRLLSSGGIVMIRDLNTSIGTVKKRFKKSLPLDLQGFSKTVIYPSPVSYETRFSRRVSSKTNKMVKKIGYLTAWFIFILTFEKFLGPLPEMLVFGISKGN